LLRRPELRAGRRRFWGDIDLTSPGRRRPPPWARQGPQWSAQIKVSGPERQHSRTPFRSVDLKTRRGENHCWPRLTAQLTVAPPAGADGRRGVSLGSFRWSSFRHRAAGVSWADGVTSDDA